MFFSAVLQAVKKGPTPLGGLVWKTHPGVQDSQGSQLKKLKQVRANDAVLKEAEKLEARRAREGGRRGSSPRPYRARPRTRPRAGDRVECEEDATRREEAPPGFPILGSGDPRGAETQHREDAASALARVALVAPIPSPRRARRPIRAVPDELARSRRRLGDGCLNRGLSHQSVVGGSRRRRYDRLDGVRRSRRRPASLSSSPANPGGSPAADGRRGVDGGGRIRARGGHTGGTRPRGRPPRWATQSRMGLCAPGQSRGNALTRPFDAHGRPTIGSRWVRWWCSGSGARWG